MENLLLSLLLIGEAIFICFMPIYLIDILRKFEPIKGYRPFSPNWLTFYSVPIFLLGITLYQFNFGIEVVLFLIVFGMSIDRLDGRFASRQEADEEDGKSLWRDFNYPGGTNMGKAFDPLADKIRNISAIVLISFFINFNLPETILWWAIIIVIVISEIGGTIIRFDFLKEFRSNQISANGVGKVKVFLQNTFIISFFIYKDGWFDLTAPLWLILGATVVLSTTSFASKLKVVTDEPKIKQFLRLFTALFSHKKSFTSTVKRLFVFFYKMIKFQH